MNARLPAIARRAAAEYEELSQADASFLSVDGLCKYYAARSFRGTRPIKSLDGVTLRIPKGEIMGIVGESGCGKSTLAKVITRLTSA
ncbi:MAG: ATP-binding cassette domain-containing protein, partial [Paracoccaceae bacterium]|nr:ATP-binding cassette domain-containing protein [Paracoccaceae bacterium]